LLDNGLLKHISETAHTETSIAGQRLNKRCSRNNQYARDKINVLPKNENTFPKQRRQPLWKGSPSRRCLLVRPTVEYNRSEVRSEERSEKTREKTRSELRSGKTRGRPDQRSDQRRRASQVASSGRRYFGVTVVVNVNELSNKELRLIRNPIHFLSRNPGHVTILT
jgi:hypothetical protein